MRQLLHKLDLYLDKLYDWKFIKWIPYIILSFSLLYGIYAYYEMNNNYLYTKCEIIGYALDGSANEFLLFVVSRLRTFD